MEAWAVAVWHLLRLLPQVWRVVARPEGDGVLFDADTESCVDVPAAPESEIESMTNQQQHDPWATLVSSMAGNVRPRVWVYLAEWVDAARAEVERRHAEELKAKDEQHADTLELLNEQALARAELEEMCRTMRTQLAAVQEGREKLKAAARTVVQTLDAVENYAVPYAVERAIEDLRAVGAQTQEVSNQPTPTSDDKTLNRCGYCKVWRDKPCGNDCEWEPLTLKEPKA